MNELSRFRIARGLVIAGAIGMMLSLGCKSGEPSGGSDGACTGGSVRMTQVNSGPSCAEDQKPTVTMTGSVLGCSVKTPSSPIVVDCSGPPGNYQNCTFESFEFNGISLLSPVTFEGEFRCGTNPAMIAEFTPNQIPGKTSPDPIPDIDVVFVVQ